MSDRPPLLDVLNPDPEAEARVVGRLRHDLEGEAPPDIQAMLSPLAEVDPFTLRRVRRRLDGAQPTARPSPPRWVLGPLALAAATLALALWPDPPPAPSSAPDAPALAEVRPQPAPTAPLALSSTEAWQTVQIDEDIVVDSLGLGTVRSDGTRTNIDWDQGELRVRVRPDRGRQVQVDTDEAQVRVVGTEFSVVRDLRGTRVGVASGVVEVTCAGSPSARLRAGGIHQCLPITGAELLRLATVLGTEGAPDTTILEVVRAGLAAPMSAHEHQMLLFKQVTLLARMGRLSEARAQADRYHALGFEFRADEITTIAARHALLTEGCDGARTYLERLDPTTAATLAPDCAP